MRSFHLPIALDKFCKSYGLVASSGTSTRAVVFVHGFGGQSTTTWRNFQGLIDKGKFAAKWNSTDVFFYAYESIQSSIQTSAEDFSRFIQRILSSGTTVSVDFQQFPFRPSSLAEPITWEPPTYSELIIAAHSEGAVVVRRAILNRLISIRRQFGLPPKAPSTESRIADLLSALKADPLMRAKLRLFAPACLGTNFAGALGFFSSYFDLLYAISVSFKARNDLLPDSPILRQISSETEAAYERYPELDCFRAEILFGSRDHVVHVGGYNCDLLLDLVRGETHTGVCKPSESYERPLEFLQ